MSGEPVTGDVMVSGRRIGRTRDLERTFLEQVERVARGESCYVVAGTGSSDEFVERVRAICPVVIEPHLHGAALILTGEPSEWGHPTAAEVEALSRLARS